MSHFLRNLSAASAIGVCGAELMAATRQLQTDSARFNELRTAARITRDYGASRPVMELSTALESLAVMNADVPSIESLDILPARKNDSRTTSLVSACENSVSSESAVLKNWSQNVQTKLGNLFEISYENLGSLAECADNLAAALETQIADEEILKASPYTGLNAASVTSALESASSLAEHLSNLDDTQIGSVEYQSACRAGFESLADASILKARGVALNDGALVMGAREAAYEPINGSLESAGFNIPETVSALGVAAQACRSVMTMLENRVNMAECLSQCGDNLPAAESIDGVSTEGMSLNGARTLMGNYVTLTTQLIEGVVENTISALGAAESIAAIM